jgi:hypothetical protein
MLGLRAKVIAALLMLLVGTAVSEAGIIGRRAGQASGSTAMVTSVGTVIAIQQNTIVLKPDSGPQVKVLVQGSTHMVQIQPGQKTLKGAMPTQLQDLQVGDRLLVRGSAATTSVPMVASAIILMKRSAIEQRQRQEEEDWQQHGVGGLVKSVDPSNDTLTIAATVKGAIKTITIHTSKDTILRRYAPGSVSFQAAKPGTFAQIRAGDQLRARGTLSADGGELAAVEVVSGSFRNIAGTVMAIDPTANQLTVMDLLSKSPVTVKVTPASELRKLPAATAEMIAVRLKSAPAGGAPANGAGAGAAPSAQPHHQEVAGHVPGQGSPHGPPGSGQGAAPDLDQILRRQPPITVGDLHKGDAVMIVSTEGTMPGEVTAIKLVSGVAPILTASPSSGRRAALQSLWSGFGASGGSGGGEGETATPAH